MHSERADSIKTTKNTSLDLYSTKLAVPTGSEHTRKKRKTRRRKKKPWSKKEKRAYQRALSGIRTAGILGKPLRFMSLTTAPYASRRDLNRDFEKLKKRVRRKFGFFEYFKVRTNEGFGVLHVLYRGTYISHKWLKKKWSEVHGGSYIVDIRAVKREMKRLAGYLVSQYIAGQSFIRMSWSWKWVFKAFVRVWKSIVYRCRGEPLEKILTLWKKILSQHCFKQVSIYEFLEEHPPPSGAWLWVSDDCWRGRSWKFKKCAKRRCETCSLGAYAFCG